MTPLRLALADLRYDLLHFICAVVLVAAMVGPLLILIGVKVGAITVLMSDLRDDPDNLSVFIEGSHVFDNDDVERVRALPGVAFAEGQNIVTTTGRLTLRRAPDGARAFSGGYATTGPGDPLTLKGGEIGNDQVILSSAFARRLEVGTGDLVTIELERGRPNPGVIEPEFSVLQVLPPETISGNFVLLSAEALSWIEAYGFGYALPFWGVEEGEPLAAREDRFEKIRIYVDDLVELARVTQMVEELLYVQASSRAVEVEAILALESDLGAALGFVTGAGVVGLFFVLAALFWSAVRRKQLNWSLLCLMGKPPVALACVPVIQAALVSIAGFLGGLLVYALVERSIDAWFGSALGESESIAVLPTGDALLVALAVVVISVLSSAVAGYSVLRTDPAAIIRSS